MNRTAKFVKFVTRTFADALLDHFSRDPRKLGITRTVTKALSADLYYMRQNDGTPRLGELNADGTSWSIKM